MELSTLENQLIELVEELLKEMQTKGKNKRVTIKKTRDLCAKITLKLAEEDLKEDK